MKRRLIKITLKRDKNVTLFKPNDIRLSFYITPIDENLLKTPLKSVDLTNSIISSYDIDFDLFDINIIKQKPNVYALFDEGVLKNQPTGADLGIYNYSKIDKKWLEKSKINEINNHFLGTRENTSTSYDDIDFRYCILAEESPLSYNNTKVIKTFRGYLEVTKPNQEFSYIRKSDYTNSDIPFVKISNNIVSMYQLRNGDEIVCSHKQDGEDIVTDSIFSINQQSCTNWNVERPWFKQLDNIKSKKLKSAGEFTKAISSKFNMLDSDNMLLYLCKSSSKTQSLIKFIDELVDIFDKVIYINVAYNPSIIDMEERYSVTKFCANPNDEIEIQISTAVLGAQYAKRMVEMGKRVAIVVDDVDAIVELDRGFAPETPISKTIVSSIKSTHLGSCAGFMFVSLRLNSIKSYKSSNILKLNETLGVVIENNQVDLFNSYRV